MSQDIVFEVNFFLHSFIMGVVITFTYDWFLILRRSIKHNMLVISLEDILFWMACAISVFYMLYEENNGILRWFAVIGATIGMLLYKKIISKYFVDIMSMCIIKVFQIIVKVILFFLKPIRFIVSKVYHLYCGIIRKIRRLLKFLKKKLTVWIKLLKITLCKQKSEKSD